MLFKRKKKQQKVVEVPSSNNDNLKVKDFSMATIDKFWEIVSPDGVGIKSKEDTYLTIQQNMGGTVYARPFHIPSNGYNRVLRTGWLQQMTNSGEVDLSVDVHKLSKSEAMKTYERQIKILDSNLTMQTRRGASRETINDIQTKIADLTRIMDEIQLDMNDGYYIGINGVLYAESLKALNELSNNMEDELANQGFKIKPTFGRVKKGYKSGTPFSKNLIHESLRNFDRRSLSTMSPFISGSGFYNGGIPIGNNLITGQKEFYNAFGTPENRPKNYNMAIFGIAGSGKSVSMKLLLERETVGLGVFTRQIDVEGEFVAITRSLGGINITLSEEGDMRINPLDVSASMVPVEDVIEGNDIDEEIADLEQSDDRIVMEKDGKKFVYFVPIREKINEAIDFFDILMRGKEQDNGGLDVFETSYIEDAMNYLYREDPRFQFTTHPDSLFLNETNIVDGQVFQGKIKKEMPTLTDVHAYLMEHHKDEPRAAKLIRSIRSFLRDGAKPIFDGQTYFGKNIDTDLNKARLVNFNLKNMEEGSLRPIAYHVILQYLWEGFAKAPELMYEKKVINCDEFAQFIKNHQTVLFAEKLARRCRKRNCAFRIASQDFVVVANSPEARAILQNTQTFMFFEQNKIDLKLLEETFNLSQGEINIINNAPEKGECIFKQGTSSVRMRTDPSPTEMKLIESNIAVLEENRRREMGL